MLPVPPEDCALVQDFMAVGVHVVCAKMCVISAVSGHLQHVQLLAIVNMLARVFWCLCAHTLRRRTAVCQIRWSRDRLPTPVSLGFPCGSAGKESACNAGDLGSIPGLGRSPEEGKGYPLQYPGLENSMDCIVQGSQRVGQD